VNSFSCASPTSIIACPDDEPNAAPLTCGIDEFCGFVAGSAACLRDGACKPRNLDIVWDFEVTAIADGLILAAVSAIAQADDVLRTLGSDLFHYVLRNPDDPDTPFDFIPCVPPPVGTSNPTEGDCPDNERVFYHERNAANWGYRLADFINVREDTSVLYWVQRSSTVDSVPYNPTTDFVTNWFFGGMSCADTCLTDEVACEPDPNFDALYQEHPGPYLDICATPLNEIGTQTTIQLLELVTPPGCVFDPPP
jgi:hypothetical protein